MSRSEWHILWKNKHKQLNFKNAALVAGLPGIGNAAKVAVDFMIDNLKAKLIATVFSHSLPPSVFVNDKNLVELPKIGLWYARVGKRDIVILGGDIQPPNEDACYAFCETVLDALIPLGVTEVITLAGIGLRMEPNDPKLYCTGTETKHVKRVAEKTRADNKIYGVVGPIVLVSGVLLGTSMLRKIPASCLLVETLGHPLHLSISGGRKLLVALSKYLNLKLDFKSLEKELSALESEIKAKTEDAMGATPQKIGSGTSELNYIG